MAAPLTVKVDPKGRPTIPQRIRDELGIEPGDTFFVEADGEHAVVRYAKAENPFDALAEHAIAEHRAGRTRGLRAYAAEHGIDLVPNPATNPSSS
jgi:AbrB family looped-hinge helix DNA binding protein